MRLTGPKSKLTATTESIANRGSQTSAGSRSDPGAAGIHRPAGGQLTTGSRTVKQEPPAGGVSTETVPPIN